MAQRTILSLDIGHVRTGVARAFIGVNIASPMQTISNTDNLAKAIQELVVSENAAALVVGLPRNLNGDDTMQTEYVRNQVDKIKPLVSIPIYFTDEALTSHKAEKELADRKKPYSKEDIDMLSATYILEDFLLEHAGDIANV